MNDKIDFQSNWLKRTYEEDKFFYNLLSGLSLATLIALVSIVDDSNKMEIKDVSMQTLHYVSATLDTKDQIDENNDEENDEISNGQDLDTEENKDSIDANNLMDGKNVDGLKSYSVDEFKKKFDKHFESQRQNLIDKYSKFFGSEKLDFKVYKDFVLEFSFAQSVAIRKAQRDLGWNSKRDAEIEVRVELLKEKFLKSFKLKLYRVLSSEDKLRELENILNETKYIDVQPSLFDVYDSEVNGGNCVTRALETTLLLEALNERLGSSGTFDTVGLLIMPGHIVATASNQMTGKTTLIDSSNSVLDTEEVGLFYTGGQKMQVLLGGVKPQNPKNQFHDFKNTGFTEKSSYLGVNPSGEVSNINPKDYLQNQQRLVQRKFNQQLSKYIKGLSKDKKETLEHSLSEISNLEIKNEYLKFIESGGDSEEFLKSKQMQILRSNGIGTEITLEDLKNKKQAFKDLFELNSLHPGDYSIKIMTNSVGENQKSNQFKIFFRINIYQMPKTLQGIQTNIVDISRLEDLSELLRQNEIQEVSKDDQVNQDLQELDLIDSSSENAVFQEEPVDSKESKRIPELYIAWISRYQFKKLAQMDLSRVKTIFSFTGSLSFNDFKNLDGFNGIISIQNLQKFDFSLLKSVDLSKATFSLGSLSFKEFRFLLQANIGQFLIESVENLQDIVENDLYTLNPNANFIIDKSLKNDPEFKILSRQAKYKTFLSSLKGEI